MRVIELAVHQVRVPLKRAIRHASHVRRESDNLVVACKLESGQVGYGEGVPRDYVTGESLDQTWGLLKQADWPGLFAKPPASLAAAVEQLEAFKLPAIADDTRQCQSNGGRCAVELALLDAYGQGLKEPLSAVTKLVAPDLHSRQDKVRYSGAITSATGFKLKLAAMAMKMYGFAHLKVKVGIAGQEDPARLNTIRRLVGSHVELRVDANEAWSTKDVAERIEELAHVRLRCVEQPVKHEDVGCLAQVRKSVKVPIMLDESLCSRVDAETAVRDQTCDLFNLRLSKCGGFIPTLRLAQYAAANGIECQLGCQVGETALLSAAGRHFASSVKGMIALEGSYDRRLVKETLATHDITFGYGGWAPALTSPGLGIQVDLAALERVTVRREVLFAR